MPNPSKGRSRLDLRIGEDMHVWLMDYSKRIGKPMSAILKEYMEKLRREDKGAKYAKQGG